MTNLVPGSYVLYNKVEQKYWNPLNSKCQKRKPSFLMTYIDAQAILRNLYKNFEENIRLTILDINSCLIPDTSVIALQRPARH
jgi:hypothetical protein